MLKKVVIIGAGPCGLLLAHYLLRRGQSQIEIYERRDRQSFAQGTGNRTFPVSLQERGRKAMRGIPGLEEAIAAESVFCQGTVVYQPDRKPRKIPRKNAILTIDRNRLVAIFLRQLTEQYSSDRVKVHFGCECTQVDGTAKTVTLQPQEGDSFTVNYDLLVGADGARSRIREYLQSHTDLQCDRHYVRDAYKSVFLNRLNANLGIELERDRIHAANTGNNTRMILVPQPGDKLHGTIIFDERDNPLEQLTTKEEILAFFQEKFPLFRQLMPESEAEALLQRPVARVLTVRCDRFHDGDRIMLIGDAAHAVSPSIGQGCNSALEDVLILDRLLEQYGDDWEKVLPQFSQQRIPDAHALQELSDYSFPRNKFLIAEFFLRLTIGRLLHQWFPRWFQPFVFDLVLDTDMPYSRVLNLNKSWVNRVKKSAISSSIKQPE